MNILVLTTDKYAHTHSEHFLRQLQYLNHFKGIHIDILKDGSLLEIEKQILSKKYQCMFPTTVFEYSEDGTRILGFNQTLFKILEYYNQPYIGSTIYTHLLLNDKALSSSRSGLGLDSRIIVKNMWEQERNLYGDYLNTINYPVIVKPNTLAASLGITENSIAYNSESVSGLVDQLFHDFDCLTEVLIEKFLLDSKEYTVSVTGNPDKYLVNITALNSTTLNREIFSYKNKEKASKERTFYYSVENNDKIYSIIKDEAIRLTKLFNIRDFTRFDFLLDANQKIYLIDANSIPFMGHNYLYEYTSRGILTDEQLFGLLLMAFQHRTGSQLPCEMLAAYPELIRSMLL